MSYTDDNIEQIAGGDMTITLPANTAFSGYTINSKIYSDFYEVKAFYCIESTVITTLTSEKDIDIKPIMFPSGTAAPAPIWRYEDRIKNIQAEKDIIVLLVRKD